jgi:hypothetical protein
MKHIVLIATLLSIGASGAALAVDEYNPVPPSDPQYKQCIAYAAKLGWEGGEEKSPIKGQSKVQAFCTCMWNETPDDFKGNLATLADSPRGKKINKICEKYANWYE